MKVELFVSPSCPHADAARQIVVDAMTESGEAGEPVITSISDYETAKAQRFFGSPTVRVDGVDVEYGDREPDEISTSCRFYNSANGWEPLPRKELVARGIDTARRRAERAQQA
jgi:hypothetical protein